MRLIDADDFREDLKIERENLFLNGILGTPQDYEEIDGFINRLDARPTIEADPVRHSEWIRDEIQPFTSFWLCDECNESFPVRAWGKNLMNYCPNCGAKMEGLDEQLP